MISVADLRGFSAPKLNEKLIHVAARLGDTIVVPCVAYANPPPTNR